MQSSDQLTLIQQAIAGDSRAFRILVEKHQAFVYSLCYRFVGNNSDAEDITQEVFIRLWKNLARYRPDIKLTTWLYTITTNICLDFLKSRHRKQLYNTSTVENCLTISDPFMADQPLLNEELKMIIVKMSDLLTPKQKAVFILRDMEGLDVNEVCEILSMSQGNVKSNLYYSRIKMTELIKQYYSDRKLKHYEVREV
jgi:RNA polymerase sigma-70 factor (ECF subfamily)